MHGLAALCHAARKGRYNGSRSTYTWRASSLLDVPGNPRWQMQLSLNRGGAETQRNAELLIVHDRNLATAILADGVIRRFSILERSY